MEGVDLLSMILGVCISTKLAFCKKMKQCETVYNVACNSF